MQGDEGHIGMDQNPQRRIQIDQLLAHFRRGYEPFVIHVFKSTHGEVWQETLRTTPEIRVPLDANTIQLDATALVRIILAHWDTTFTRVLDKRDRALFYELRQIRNRWAHQAPLTDDDVDRMADTVLRLLTSIRADNVNDVLRMREEFRHARYVTRPAQQKIAQWILIGVVGVVTLVSGVWWFLPQGTTPPTTDVQPTPAASVTHAVLKSSMGNAVTATAVNSTDASFPCAIGQIKGNPKTMIYHPPDGAYYANTRNAGVVCFDTTTAAEAAGYRASKR